MTKRSEFPVHLQKSLVNIEVTSCDAMDRIVAELKDIQAQLYGGYSHSFGFEITTPQMPSGKAKIPNNIKDRENEELINKGLGEQVMKLGIQLMNLSSVIKRHETLVEVVPPIV